MNVLFVDDEKGLLDQSKIFLEREDERLEVDTSISAEKALTKFENNDYDVIVSDYQMPDMNGLEFLKAIRKDKDSDIPFIIFTGKGREEVAIEALNIGADRYIQKGGDMKSQYGVLAKTVKQEVKRKKSEEEVQKFSTMVTNSSEAIICTDEDLNINFVNESAEEMFGYSQEEIIGKSLGMLNAESKIENLQEKILESISSNGTYKDVHLNEKKDGDLFYCEMKISPLSDEKDSLKGYVASQRDITERKKAEEQVEHLNSLLKAIRNVNHLIMQSDDLEEIMQNASEYLVGARSYLGCTIGLLDEESREISPVIERGKTKDLPEWCITEDGVNDAPLGIEKAIEKDEIKVLEFKDRPDSGFTEKAEFEKTISVPMKKRDETIGIMYIGLDKHVNIDEEEKQLLKDVANDLAFAREKIKAERKLKENEQKYRTLVETTGDLIFIHDKKGDIEFVNKSGLEFSGYTEDEILGKNIMEFLPKEELESLLQRKEKRVKKGNKDRQHFETAFINKDEERVDVDVQSTPFFENDEFKGELVVARDVTERKEREKELKRYKKIFEELSDPVMLQDSEGKYIQINEAVSDYAGIPKEELIGKDESEFMGESSYQKIVEKKNEVIEKEQSVEYEMEVDHEDKDECHIKTSRFPFYDTDDNLMGTVAICIDITEQKKKEEKRRIAELKYRNLFDKLADALFLEDTDGNILEVNDAACELLGYSQEELEGMTVEEIVPEEKEIFLPEKRDQLSFEEGRLETINVSKDGTRIPVELQGAMIEIDGEKRILVSLRDIRERKEIEEELRESEKRYRRVAENMNDVITMVNQEGKILYGNKKAHREVLGYDVENIVGKNAFELFHPSDRDKVVKLFEEALENEKEKQTIEARFRCKDGSYKWIESSGRFFPDGKALVISRDVSERKIVEEELREARARMSTLLSTIPSYVYMKDEDLKFVEANEALCDMLGVSKEEIKGKNDYDLFPEEFAESYQTDDRKVIETGQPVTDRIEKLPVEDGNINWVLTNKRPIRDEDGNIEGLVGQTMDITERKEAEEREKLLHSLLRHDVANKNRVVKGYLHLLEDYELPEEAEEYLKNSKKSIEKSLNLIQKVRTLREAQDEEIEEVDITSAVDEAVEQAERTGENAGMKIERDCPKRGCMVEAGSLINNVFLNIIENSIKHSEGSKLKVRGEVKEDEVVCIFEDNGKGIPEEDKQDIFEKGYTTDEERGTGLGLFLVKMLLDIYEGEIEVKESELGGSRFDIHLKRG